MQVAKNRKLFFYLLSNNHYLFSKFKSLFSPSDISATFPSLENEKFISPKIKTIENDQSDEGIKSKHNEIAKNASKNQGSKLVQLVLLNGDTEKKDNDPNNEL